MLMNLMRSGGTPAAAIAAGSPDASAAWSADVLPVPWLALIDDVFVAEKVEGCGSSEERVSRAVARTAFAINEPTSKSGVVFIAGRRWRLRIPFCARVRLQT